MIQVAGCRKTSRPSPIFPRFSRRIGRGAVGRITQRERRDCCESTLSEKGVAGHPFPQVPGKIKTRTLKTEGCGTPISREQITFAPPAESGDPWIGETSERLAVEQLEVLLLLRQRWTAGDRRRRVRGKGNPEKEKPTPRPRFKNRTWGTLRVFYSRGRE